MRGPLLPVACLLAASAVGCAAPPPTLEGLEIAVVPDAPGADDDLIATVVVQADGHDATGFSYAYSWSADGVLQDDLATRKVPADRTVGGQEWEVVVTPTFVLGNDTLTGTPSSAVVVVAAEAVVDSDGDGFEGEGGDGSDCDDTDPAVFPGAQELCDEVDNDCNDVVDDTEDLDGDGVFACLDCDDGDPTVFPGAEELCDGIDNDCAGGADDGLSDEDGDGFTVCDDCDDDDPDAFPGNPESCEVGSEADQVDNDCNPLNDTNGMAFYFEDADGDGVGAITPELWCGGRPEGYVDLGGDCDDTDPDINPSAVEDAVNGVDDDCDAEVDEVTFEWIFLDVVVPSCGCHSGSTHSSGFAFAGSPTTFYDVSVDIPSSQADPTMDLVEPGDSTLSYLMHKLDDTQDTVGGSGTAMPPSAVLDADVRDAIRAWIDEGAPN